MTLAPRRSPASLALLLGLVACDQKATPGDPVAPSPSTSVATTAPSAPVAAPSPESTASAAPAPSAPKEGSNCYPAAESKDIGSSATAEPPFADCAKNLKVHCSSKVGERGHLTGLALDVKATTAARKQKPDACCYASCD